MSVVACRPRRAITGVTQPKEPALSTIRILALTAALAGGAAYADEPAVTADVPALHPMIETDLLIYAFAPLSGWQAIVGMRTPELPRWGFKAVVVYFPLPDSLVNSNPNNAGFHVRSMSFGAIAHYHFSNDRGGFVAGPVVALGNTFYRRDDTPDQSAHVTDLDLGAQVAYQWFPFHSLGLYALPNLGVTYALHLEGEPTVGGKTYQSSPIGPLFGLHVGYEF